MSSIRLPAYWCIVPPLTAKRTLLIQPARRARSLVQYLVICVFSACQSQLQVINPHLSDWDTWELLPIASLDGSGQKSPIFCSKFPGKFTHHGCSFNASVIDFYLLEYKLDFSLRLCIHCISLMGGNSATGLLSFPWTLAWNWMQIVVLLGLEIWTGHWPRQCSLQ